MLLTDRYTPGPQSPPSMSLPSAELSPADRFAVQVVHSPFARTFSDAGRAIIGRGQTVSPRRGHLHHPLLIQRLVRRDVRPAGELPRGRGL
jgi:hypothetical protein